MASISNPQIRMIYALARECGLDNETVHLKAHALTGADSLKQLSQYDANRLIAALQHECGQEEATVAYRATAAHDLRPCAVAGLDGEPKAIAGVP